MTEVGKVGIRGIVNNALSFNFTNETKSRALTNFHYLLINNLMHVNKQSYACLDHLNSLLENGVFFNLKIKDLMHDLFFILKNYNDHNRL